MKQTTDMQLPRVTQEHVLEQLSDRAWAPTGVVARALLPNGGRGVLHRLRREHHERVRELLRVMEADGLVESRWTAVGDADGQHEQPGRKEWRKAPLT